MCLAFMSLISHLISFCQAVRCLMLLFLLLLLEQLVLLNSKPTWLNKKPQKGIVHRLKGNSHSWSSWSDEVTTGVSASAACCLRLCSFTAWTSWRSLLTAKIRLRASGVRWFKRFCWEDCSRLELGGCFASSSTCCCSKAVCVAAERRYQKKNRKGNMMILTMSVK